MLPYPSTSRALLDAGLLAKDHLAPCPSSLVNHDDLGENVRVVGSKVPGLRFVVLRMTLLRAYRMSHRLAQGETADEYLRRYMRNLQLGEYLDEGHHRYTLPFVAGGSRSDSFRHCIRASLVFRGHNDVSRLHQMRNAKPYPSVRALVHETSVQSLFLAFVRLKSSSSFYHAYLLPRRCLACANDDRGVVCLCAYKLDHDAHDDAGVKTLLCDDIVSLFVADFPAVRPSAGSSSFSLANFPSGREVRELERLFDDLWLQHLNARRLGDFGCFDPMRVQLSGGVESLGTGLWWMYGDVVRREVCLSSTTSSSPHSVACKTDVDELMSSNVIDVFTRRDEVVEVYFDEFTRFPPLRACVVRHGHPTCLLYTLRLKAGVLLEPDTEDERRLIQGFRHYVGSQAKALTLQKHL